MTRKYLGKRNGHPGGVLIVLLHKRRAGKLIGITDRWEERVCKSRTTKN